MSETAINQISTRDWEATPPAVRNVLLSLERERNTFRERMERLEHAREATTKEHGRRLTRYHSLVEQQYLAGLSPEQQREIEQLGEEIDSVNSAFYPSLESLAETVAAQTGKTTE
jgi:hypothetical protein